MRFPTIRNRRYVLLRLRVATLGCNACLAGWLIPARNIFGGSIMRTGVHAAIAAVWIGSCGVASATDLMLKNPPPEYEYTPVTLWTGPYVGAHLGGARGKADITDTYAYNSEDPVMGSKIGSTRFIGGVQLGYNRQTGHLVYGIEADVGKLSIAGKTSAHLQDAASNANPRNKLDANYSISSGLYGDLTGRIGHVSNNTLLYLKGGAAFLNVDADASYIGGDAAGYNTFNFGKSDTMWGWTIGVGVEYALTSSLSLKAEYQHFDFGTMSFSHNVDYRRPNTGMFSHLSGKNDVDVTADAVTIGLNYNLSGNYSALK